MDRNPFRVGARVGARLYPLPHNPEPTAKPAPESARLDDFRMGDRVASRSNREG